MVDRWLKQKAFPDWSKYREGFLLYVALLTKCKYKCEQCHKEYAKCEHILKIKMIFHKHHLHSVRIEADRPVTRLPVEKLPALLYQ